MVLGDRVFCLCKLRHSGPDNSCHGPNVRSSSLTRSPVDRKSSQTESPYGHSGSLNRAPDSHSGSLNLGRSRPREGCCPRSTCRRSCGWSHSSRSRSSSLTRGPVDRKNSQTRSPNAHSGSLNRAPDGHSDRLNCGWSWPREGCCPRSASGRSCGRSHSESRPTRCRQYQQGQGGKLGLVQKTNIFLIFIILLDRCHIQRCPGSRVPRVQKFIRDLATGTCHPIKMT